MRPVIIIAIVLLISISIYLLYSSTQVIEEEGLANYRPSSEDITTAMQLTSMDNGPMNFGGFPNQIGQQGIPMSQMRMYSGNNPLIQQRASSWSMPVTEDRMGAPNRNRNARSFSNDDYRNQLSVSADALSNAFDANGNLKDEALIPLQTEFNSFITSLKTNLTKDKLDEFLTQIIEVATTLKQRLNSGYNRDSISNAGTTTGTNSGTTTGTNSGTTA